MRGVKNSNLWPLDVFYYKSNITKPFNVISDKLEAEEAAVMAEIEEDGEESDEDEEMEDEEGKFINPN